MGEGSRGNPFPESDRDRHAIWGMLVSRDSEAFVAQDWARVEGDFDAARFEGIHANGSHDPDRWTLRYATLEAYRDDWLSEAASFVKLEPLAGTPLELLLGLSSMNEIEIRGDRALGHKKFRVAAALKGGGCFRALEQSLYRLHRIDGAWKIVGFVGYLPLV